MDAPPVHTRAERARHVRQVDTQGARVWHRRLSYLSLGTCNSSMKACGDTGIRGSSDGGGAGVNSNERTREKVVACGIGSVTSELGPHGVTSHGADRERPCVCVNATFGGMLPLDGSDERGYRSNIRRMSSMISCFVPTSPGRLSEYKRVTSCAKGVGQQLRSATHPTEDVDIAFTHRSSSCRT